MKKKIALLLAATMVVGTLPMTAFAASTNKVSAVKTVKDDTAFNAEIAINSWDAGVEDGEEQTVKLTLTNAKWNSEDYTTRGVDFKIMSNTMAYATFAADLDAATVLYLDAKSNGSGEATVTIDSLESAVTSGTFKIANIVGGATTTTVDDTVKIVEGGSEIEPIVITETVKDTLKGGEIITLKLTNGFEWVLPESLDYSLANDNNLTLAYGDLSDKQVLEVKVTGDSAKAATVVLKGLAVAYDADDVEVGDECEVTISGAGVTKETIKLGTVTDYDVNLKVEDKDLPVFYSGLETDTKTLKVTIEETIANSWIEGRKATLTLPEGVLIKAVTDVNGFTTDLVDESELSNKLNLTKVDAFDGDDTEKMSFKLQLEVAPDFTGDIEAVLTGAALEEEQKVTIATAKAPIVVEAAKNNLEIDYRNTPATDIVITEVKEGILAKGKKVSLKVEDLKFDGKPTVEVVSGDIKVKDVEVSNGTLTFTIKQASQKEVGVIRIKGVELYMYRDIPAGEYDLSLELCDALFQNYDEDEKVGFDIDSLTVCEGYVTVVTEGRDQAKEDTTFTQSVSVTVGANKMVAGSTEIALDVPAYISGGYTMLPVRAVSEALSAVVSWSDATDTVTVFAGQRVISMTIGSKVMVVNGVEVAMNAAPEITNGRTFLPLRDLAYALGLNDDQIKWDEATKTAKLN